MVPEDLRVCRGGRVVRLVGALGVVFSEEEVLVDEVVGMEELEVLVLGAVGGATEGMGLDLVGVEGVLEVEVEDWVEDMVKASGV